MACNDASLLKYFYTKTKCYVSGMDPAKNLLKNYIKRKYRITNDFLIRKMLLNTLIIKNLTLLLQEMY